MRTLYFLLSQLAVVGLWAADSELASKVAAAAKKLEAASNYSWTAVIRSEGGGTTREVPIHGESEKDGFTFFSVKLGDNTIEAAFKGDKSAIKLDNQWHSGDELEGDRAWIRQRLNTFKPPPAEAEDLARKVKALKKEPEDLYAGDLNEEAVRELVARYRRNVKEVGSAKGWAKFWIKDDLLTKYQFRLEAMLTVGDDERQMEVKRTATVDIKTVGETKVSVPDEAKEKLKQP